MTASSDPDRPLAPADAALTALLELRNAGQSFDGVHVLRGVDLTIRAGEVHGLLGQNGSGKSTLIKILAGYNSPTDETELRLGGKQMSLPYSASEAKTAPISFVHQDLGLSDEMTIVENFGVVRWRRERGVGLRRVRWRAERARTRQAIHGFGLRCDVDTPVGALREGDRAIVAIARALSTLPSETPGVLVLDEPTASLPRYEVALLFDALRHLKGLGHGVLFVGHRLEEVLSIADTISVLRDGRLVWAGGVGDTSQAELVRAIVGHELAPVSHAPRPAAQSRVVLSVRDLTGGLANRVSFDVHEGEAVGLTGLAGMGQDAVAELLLGLVSPTAGEIASDGRVVAFASPRAAMRHGLAYLPPSRARGGALMSADVTENITLPALTRYFRRGRIDTAAERAAARALVGRFDIRPANPRARMGSLSGGNQQKALFARLEHSDARLLVLHEPTNGVDVGAREQVLATARAMKERGRSLLVISKEYEDLEAVCDRVLVFGDGEVRAELFGDAINQREISAACINATHEPQAPA